MKSLIARMQQTPPADLQPLVAEIGTHVRAHVAHEESAVVPALRDAGADADALGRRLVAAKGEAPSRSSGEVG